MIRFFCAAFLTVLLIACNARQEENTGPLDETEYPDQESWDATMLLTKEGNTVGLLKAGHVKKYSGKRITVLEDGLQVDFFNEAGEHSSVLTSNGGKVYDTVQDMEAYGNVVVVSDSGMTLATDTLKWNNKKQKIYSEIAVMITTGDADTLFGDSFVSDPDLSNYEIINPHGKTSKILKLEN